MFSKKLPSGRSDFRMSGSSGFKRKLSNLTRYGQFNNLKTIALKPLVFLMI